MQIMGPSDSYLLQYSRDVGNFWADNDSLALGTCFQGTPPLTRGPLPQVLVSSASASLERKEREKNVSSVLLPQLLVCFLG